MADQRHDPKHDPRKDQTANKTVEQDHAKAEAQTMAALNNSFVQLDEEIRKQLKLAGPPGSGLYMLLDSLAVSTLGTTRTAFPAPQTNNPGDYYRQQAPSPGVPGTSPPGPLPGTGAGQSPNANSSAPLGPNN